MRAREQAGVEDGWEGGFRPEVLRNDREHREGAPLEGLEEVG